MKNYLEFEKEIKKDVSKIADEIEATVKNYEIYCGNLFGYTFLKVPLKNVQLYF